MKINEDPRTATERLLTVRQYNQSKVFDTLQAFPATKKIWRLSLYCNWRKMNRLQLCFFNLLLIRCTSYRYRKLACSQKKDPSNMI
mmetsp:Transcript_14035/g.20101  ORF Transcript_14035/g.20101 Transcript_14035/m.20101 type:complete len:86 (-) Transcript_14035:1831-2088(-)